MKKTIFLLSFVLAIHLTMAQRTVYHHQPLKLFNQGKEMFLEETTPVPRSCYCSMFR